MREQLIQPRAIPLTCTIDGRSHRVTDHAFVAGKGDGYYRALCGHTVAVAAMASPDGPPCPSCWQCARELDADCPAGRIARHRRPGKLRRLVAPLRRRANGTRDALVPGVAAWDTHLGRRVDGRTVRSKTITK